MSCKGLGYITERARNGANHAAKAVVAVFLVFVEFDMKHYQRKPVATKKTFVKPTLREEASLAEVTLQSGHRRVLIG